MADRTCAACGRVFRYPKHLRQHELRKTPCAPILEPEDVQALYDRKTLEDPDFEKKKCSFCGRVFGTYTNMRRHVRNACKIAPNAKNGDAGMEILYEHTIRRQETRIAALERQNAEILGMMRKLVVQTAAPAGGAQVSGEIAVHNRDGTVAVDKSRKEIHIHGQEGLDHITPARIKAILDETLGGAGAGVEQAAQAAVLKSVDTLFDRQPYEEAEEYGPLMKELADNEKRYAAGRSCGRSWCGTRSCWREC
jgi:hypothetical protein